MWRPLTANLFLFPNTQGRDGPSFIAHSDDCFKRTLISSPAASLMRLDSGRTQRSANLPFRRRLDWACAVLPVLARAIHRACDPATPQAAALRPDRASAAAPRAVGLPGGFPEEAPKAVLA